MAISLPPELVSALQYLGYEFPSSDEDVLAGNAKAFRGAGRAARVAIDDVEAAIKHVTDNNSGVAYEGFVQYLRGGESNLASLKDFELAAGVVGGGFDVVAGVVVVLKLAVIAQLVLLAASIVTAALSGGLGAGLVVLAREGAKRLIDVAINVAVEQVLG